VLVNGSGGQECVAQVGTPGAIGGDTEGPRNVQVTESCNEATGGEGQGGIWGHGFGGHWGIPLAN